MDGRAGGTSSGAAVGSARGEREEHETAGLRERKKRQTRAALSQAAIALAVQRGWENVRVEDIAAAVNVSERTFRNYFSGKAEAVAATHLDRMTRVARAVDESPRTEPLWDVVDTALRFEFAPADSSAPQSSAPRPGHREAVWEVMAEPAVQAEVMRADHTAQQRLAEAIGARTGTDPRTDLYPKLVAASIGAAVGTALTHWLRADPPVPLSPLITDALEQLAAGLPAPGATEAQS
jgi:AcrR family transcriptional regulator